MLLSQRIVVLLLLVFAGCTGSSDGPSRRIVEGSVSYDNTPIAYGSIRFIPEPTGPVSVAIIIDGKYRCEGKGGVPIGTARIEIEATPNTSGMTEEEIMAKGAVSSVVIPEKYHRSSTLNETIPEGRAPYTLDFQLKK